MRANRTDARIALALLCVLLCTYWLTTGAHTSIADEETLFGVTESLVERGTFAQPGPGQAGNTPRVVTRASDGTLYAITSPLQSLLAVPLYAVGRWVAHAFPAPFYGYFTRFFVCLFNGPLGAASVALLYVFGVDLGYRRRTALFVAITYGLATIAWPYARSFYAETPHAFCLILAAWTAYRYMRIGRWTWMAAAGLALGLGMATKYVAAVAVPAFGLYVGLELGRRRWRWMLRTILAGGLPLALVLGSLAVHNYARFGSLFETGYTTSDMRGAASNWLTTSAFVESLYGFFFSSGKGFFFFSPPAALALGGVTALARRHAREVGLFAALAAVHVLFYSLIHFQGQPAWYGGGNWGPRYLVCITPFVMLPLGAFLERPDLPRWWRVGSATCLFVLGFWVQMSTVFVNHSTYLFSDVPADRQLYHPNDSTLLAQWRLWPRLAAGWQAYDHAEWASGTPFYLVGSGFYDVEAPDLPFGRWMRESGQLRLYARPEQALTVQVAYSRPRLADGGGEWTGLHALYDGRELAGTQQLVAENERERQWLASWTIPASDVQVYPGTLEMTATTWVPLELGDSRALSVFIERIDVLSDGTALPAYLASLPPPLPVSQARPWSWEAMFWFYDPRNAWPFDAWPWFVWASGVPLEKARAFIIVLSLALGIGLLASSAWLFRLIRRRPAWNDILL